MGYDKMSYHLKRGKTMKKRLKQLAVLIVLFWSWHAVWLYFNLDVGETPVLSDVIIVPEGGDGREDQAGQLLLDGYSLSDRIIVSPLYGENLNLLPRYQNAGVREDQIIAENEATSTYTNAVNTLELMEENGWGSALVVTSDYHMRRTRMIYERVNRHYDFDLTYISAYVYTNEGVVITYLDTPGLRSAGRREIYKYYGYLFGLYHFLDLD